MGTAQVHGLQESVQQFFDGSKICRYSRSILQLRCWSQRHVYGQGECAIAPILQIVLRGRAYQEKLRTTR